MSTRNLLRVATGLYRGLRHFSGDFAHIEDIIKNQKVVVFMKGTPTDPSCGFSSAVVQILKMWNVKYGHINVLEDEMIRQDIKKFSNWPTIPQVYIDGQFIGGCDIMLEMHRNGELKEVLKKANLLDEESISDKKGSSEEGKNEEKSS